MKDIIASSEMLEAKEKVPQIVNQLEGLDQTIGQLHEEVIELEERLVKIMSPPVEHSESEKSVRENYVPLAEILYKYNGRIWFLREKIEDIKTRLEL